MEKEEELKFPNKLLFQAKKLILLFSNKENHEIKTNSQFKVRIKNETYNETKYTS